MKSSTTRTDLHLPTALRTDTRASCRPNSTTAAERKSPLRHRALTTLPALRHLLAPFAVAAMLLGLAGNANAQALSFGAEPSIDDQVYTVGQAVNVTLPEATGGVAPLTYDLTATDGSALPPPIGLVINPTNRTLTGTPSLQVAEAVSYRWTVTDSASPAVSQSIDFTITVNAAPEHRPGLRRRRVHRSRDLLPGHGYYAADPAASHRRRGRHHLRPDPAHPRHVL